MPAARQPLKVLPILVWDHARRAEQRSWRHWGGIERPEQAAEEVKRIERELGKITQGADFPVEFMKVASVNNVKQMADSAELKAADAVIVYGAGINVNGCQDFGKDVIIFQRHRSGPVYLQYEVVSPRFLRQHTDTLAFKNITFDDVVTDSLDELTWRLRALCGLKNTKSSKIMCIGGAGGWAQPAGVIPELVKKVWDMDLQTVSYDDLGVLIKDARADKAAVALAKRRAEPI